jgi:hypothetical protein
LYFWLYALALGASLRPGFGLRRHYYNGKANRRANYILSWSEDIKLWTLGDH